MKQFIICLWLTIIVYFIGVSAHGVYNPVLWGFRFGTCILYLIIMFIWIVPIGINYLDSKENFK